MSKIIIKDSCSLSIKLYKELTNFNDDQKQAIKDINLILDCAGLKIYGSIGK